MEPNDGVDDVTDALSRTAVTVAAQIGRQLARAVQHAHEEAAARRTAEAAQLQARLDAQRATAAAELAVVHQQQWWGSVGSQQVARVVEMAQTWAAHDADAAAAARVVRQEVQDRFGVDVDPTGPHTVEILHATHAAASDRADAAKQPASSEQEAGEARLLLFQGIALQDLADESKRRADELEHDVDWDRGGAGDFERFAEAQEHLATSSEQRDGAERDGAEQKLAGSADLHDSAERRQALAAQLEQRGASAEQVRDRLLADADQARHPIEATRARSGLRNVANREPLLPARSRGHDRGR